MSKLNVRSTRVFSAAMCAFGLIVGSAIASAASEAQNASECMAFEQDTLEHGVEYRLINHCERRVTCNVRWTLYCGDRPPLRQINNSSNATITPSDERRIVASAAACADNGWEISRVSWSCAP